MKDIKYVNEWTRAVKVMVVSNNQICLDKICWLAGELKQAEIVSSGSRLNHNGGFLMHFNSEQGLKNSLQAIKSVTESSDQNAEIIVYNQQPATQ